MTKEEDAARKRLWRKDHPEKHREDQRKYYARHRSTVRLKQKRHREEHPETLKKQGFARRARHYDSEGSFTGKQWLRLCKAFLNTCLCCNKKKSLAADHVVPISKGGTSWIANIQPLCKVCNSKKFTKSTDFRIMPKWRTLFVALWKRKWFCSESRTQRNRRATM